MSKSSGTPVGWRVAATVLVISSLVVDGALALAINVASGQGHWPGVLDLARRYPWWASLALLGGAALLAVLLLVVSEKAQGGGGFQLAVYFRLIDRRGRAPLVRAVSARDMGVKRPITLDGAKSGPVDTQYVGRDVDAQLRRMVARGGVVVVHGPAASGKSRSAYEVVQAECPKRRLLIPATGQALSELAASRVRLKRCVVWLDDLERFLTPGGLNAAVLDRICAAGRRDVVVVATIRDGELTRLDRAAEEAGAPESLWRWLPEERMIAMDSYLSQAERDGSDRVVDARVADALCSTDSGFAEYLAAGPAMLRRWTHGDGPVFQVGAGLISALTDCRRIGYFAAVPSGILDQLHRDYLPANWRRRADLPGVQEGLRWASEPVLGASSCITPERDDAYVVADYLVDQADEVGGPVPVRVWGLLVDVADAADCHRLGLSAHLNGHRDIARKAFLAGSEQGNSDSTFSLGRLLEGDGRTVEAERHYRTAAQGGSGPAMNNLANLLKRRGELAEAEDWYRRAVAAGATRAHLNLGLLLEQLGDPVAATRAYRHAIEHGDLAAAHRLGRLNGKLGRDDEAMRWYRVGAEGGDPHAMFHLAALHERREEVAEAERWYRRAAAAGDDRATHDLGRILERGGDLDGAAALYLVLAERGDADAMGHLAHVLVAQGDGPGAARWYEGAVRAGDADQAYNVGVAFDRAGQPDRAEKWYRRAIRRDDHRAMHALGALLLGQGRNLDAKRLFRRAADAGRPESMHNLGVAEFERGRMGEAARWFRKAVEAGRSASLNNLALSLKRQGRLDEAERWYRRAADGGDALAMGNLGVLLAEREENIEAEYWFLRSCRGGNADGANSLAVLYLSQGRRMRSRLWQARAIVAQRRRPAGEGGDDRVRSAQDVTPG